MRSGEPPSQSASSSPPSIITEVLALLTSSGLERVAPGPAGVPKPGWTMALSRVSSRRFGVSAKRAVSRATPSRTANFRISPSPSNQCPAALVPRLNLAGPLR